MSRTVLLTGASGGLGTASTIELTRRGWNVTAAVRSIDDEFAPLRDATSGHPHLRGHPESSRRSSRGLPSQVSRGGLICDQTCLWRHANLRGVSNYRREWDAPSARCIPHGSSTYGRGMGQRPVALLLTPFRRGRESLQIGMSTGPTDLPAKRPWWTFRECQSRRPVGAK